jgi:hypothetical protein
LSAIPVRQADLVDSFPFGGWELGNGIIQLIEYMIKTGKFKQFNDAAFDGTDKVA